MATELVKEVKGQTLWLTINRPERRNALNREVIRGLTEAITEAGESEDHQVRTMVLTGAGVQAFGGGADPQGGGSFAFDYSEPSIAYANLLRGARASVIPMIARVTGACMAGGMGLLAIGDGAVSARHARFGLP